MSASLVGSEMCIRDRACVCGWWEPLGLQAHAVGQLVPRGLEARVPSVPVSYTHLTLPTICSV
eukprot:1511138-Alexandrium_andersonii.AAC.1